MSKMYSMDNNDCMLQSIDPQNRFWWGILYNGKYLTMQDAGKLDCTLLPRIPFTSGLFNPYQPYMQMFPQDSAAYLSVHPEFISTPRYVKNRLDHYNNTQTVILPYRKIQEIIGSPSYKIEFSDAEPTWTITPAANIRCNYYFEDSKIGMARTTHNAMPNLSFYDGHVSFIPLSMISTSNTNLYIK